MLFPHILKLGLTTIDKIKETNKNHGVDVFEYNGKNILVDHYISGQQRVGLFFMDLGFLGNMTRGSAVLMLYDKSPSSHWDLHKLFDIQLNEHKINDSNLTIVEETIGEENIKKYYKLELDKLNAERKEKSFSTKMKKWFQ